MYLDPALSLEAELVECRDLATLLGHEGTFTKRCYAEFGRMAGLPGFSARGGRRR